jgi:hypothetical protein
MPGLYGIILMLAKNLSHHWPEIITDDSLKLL